MKTRSLGIVLSAGSGKRMQREQCGDRPKQYLPLLGREMIVYSLEQIAKSSIDDILIAANPAYEALLADIIHRHGLKKIIAVVAGGEERYDSVYASLRFAEGYAAQRGFSYKTVLVHDGARPLIERASIERILKAAKSHPSCTLAVPVKDTIKVADKEGFSAETLDRSRLHNIQTPQVFDFSLLMEGHRWLCENRAAVAASITDDTGVLEKYCACPVKLVPGDYSNLKITTREDFLLAEFLLQRRAGEPPSNGA